MTVPSNPQFEVCRRGRFEAPPRRPTDARAWVVECLQRWTREFGETPRMIDWDPSRARRLGQTWRAERFEAGDWPTAKTVLVHFEGFNAAVAEAGLTPRPTPSRLRANLASPEAVLEAIREWKRRYGDLPVMADWDPSRARSLGQDWRIARYHVGDWPSIRTVVAHFGSLSRAIEAAGLIPRGRGSQHDDRTNDRRENRERLARFLVPDQPSDALRHALQAVSAARRAGDTVALHAALIDLSSAALGLAERMPALVDAHA